MGAKPASAASRLAVPLKDRRRHLCPLCSAPCDLYIRAVGWKSRGKCSNGHDHPKRDLRFATPPQ